MTGSTTETTTDTTPSADWRNIEELALTPILQGALDTFSVHGFHGTTVRQIAARVGVTVPSLYYHHPNKEGIFVALLKVATEDIGWRVEAAIDAAGDDRATALANVNEAIVLHMTGRQKLAALDPEARYLSAENRDAYVAPRRRIEQAVTGVIQDGVADGVFTSSDPRESARALLGMWQAIARWYRPDGGLSVADVVERYREIALAAVGYRPDEG